MPVPPLGVAVALPLLPPKHNIFTWLGVIVISVGCVTTAVAVAVQELPSVTVTVYVPAVNPVAAAVA